MIVNSILDTDLYKITTSYGYMRLFPRACGTFTFNDRNKTVYSNEFVELLRDEIKGLSTISLTNEEKDFMYLTCPFIPLHYWEWLQSFRFDFSLVDISLSGDGHLQISVTDHLYKATLWEIPILAIVSELTGRVNGKVLDIDTVLNRLAPKIELSNREEIKFSEFGTRRRFSYSSQDVVIAELAAKAKNCTGTSNCHFAQKYNIGVIGTHPHEWFMFHGAIFGYQQANYLALENWVKIYDGDLGIALSDTYTSEVFFDNFSKKHAKLFDGVRQDSGNEFEFVDKAIARYKEHGIDATTKTIIFSNALNFEKALEIKRYCEGKIRCAFGIGTNLTNDTGNSPVNIVMKLTDCAITEGRKFISCVKLSDDLGKHTGSDDEVQKCLASLRI